MADNVNPNQKQPGEKQEGQYHYNPGNQSGKTIDAGKPEGEQVNNKDRIEQREEPQSR
ncbi:MULTISPECIES: hypothetical protein [unclassified Bradyrhizobium]|uniref:hypothetical protein n=1 Tax=unclassified Bradyrhizobium TaxID=2631580 RepID=UPI000150872A|nr:MULTISPECIES: hypothetical protein [unclassified Bradyrhizobium]CAL80669.1 hypothetical protein BRADO7086 [Bradyrhizobium sp. ORS 278]CCE03553.1 conserved hypothetical protein [Bradyrhizobium sp. STM 3809]